MPSPLLVGDELYIVNDGGIASCLDAKTGETIWQERIGGNFSASPLFADGRIYLLDEDGKMHGHRSRARSSKVLAENTSTAARWPASASPESRSSCGPIRPVSLGKPLKSGRW